MDEAEADSRHGCGMAGGSTPGAILSRPKPGAHSSPLKGLMQEGLRQFHLGGEELIGHRVEVFAALKMPAGLWLLQGWR
ncbi:MAG: hypothetical protein ACK5Q6_08920 [Cyanobacteriota bacterium]